MNLEEDPQESHETRTRTSRRSIKRSVRWLSAVIAVGVVLVAGFVAADVVLVYTSPTTVGSATSTLYQFDQGANYASANSLGLFSTTFNGGTSTSGPTVNTTVNGIADVTVSLFDMVEFGAAAAITTQTVVGTPYGVLGTPVAPTDLVCAYAFVSSGTPAAGTTPVPGEVAGCAVTEPTVTATALSTADCGGANTVVINLLDGSTVSGAGSITCTIPSINAGTPVLYLSYAVVEIGPVVSTAVATIAVPVTA